MNFYPKDGPLYVVRWLRADGRNMKHRYYRRRHDAHAFADKLTRGGWLVRVYLTTTKWEPQTTKYAGGRRSRPDDREAS